MVDVRQHNNETHIDEVLTVSAPTWHALTIDEVAERLNVNLQSGLDPTEAKRRAAVYGSNEITEQRRRGPLRSDC